MTASLETLVVAAYVFADSLVIPRSGPVGKVTDKELIALAVAQAAIRDPGSASSRRVSIRARSAFTPGESAVLPVGRVTTGSSGRVSPPVPP
jgi:hypothetical protein